MRSFEKNIVCPCKICDEINGKDTAIPLIYYTDGEFMWDERDIYHFEKYNIRLNDEFVHKITEVLNTENMREKVLTQDQKDRIKVITDEWEDEITKMEKEIPTPDGKHLDGKRTIAHTRLANKYMPRIQMAIRISCARKNVFPISLG